MAKVSLAASQKLEDILKLPARLYSIGDLRDVLWLRASEQERQRFVSAIVAVTEQMPAGSGDLALSAAILGAIRSHQETPGPAGNLIRRRDVRFPGTAAFIARGVAAICLDR